MRIAPVIAVLALCSFIPSAAQAEKTEKQVGNFSVTAEADAFGDGDKVVAVTVQNGAAIAIRCLEGQLSVAILVGPVSDDDKYSVKYRIDRKDIVEKDAFPLGGTALEISDSGQLIKDLPGAKEIAFRVADTTKDVFQTYTFTLRKIDAVSAEVLNACTKAK